MKGEVVSALSRALEKIYVRRVDPAQFAVVREWKELAEELLHLMKKEKLLVISEGEHEALLADRRQIEKARRAVKDFEYMKPENSRPRLLAQKKGE